MRRLLCLSLGLAACGFSGNGTSQNPDAMPDAADARLDAPPMQLCLAGFVSFCVAQPPTQDKTFTGTTTIDTATSAECASLSLTSGGDLCVVLARNLTIDTGATLRAFGPRPLALIATGALTVRGTVDVSSKRMVPTEPGAGSRTCVHMQTPGDDNGGGGGAAGGSMAFRGGDGGTGNTDGGNALRGLSGAITAQPTTALVGGCRGQQGGSGNDPGGLGGGGGGAVYLRGASIALASGSEVRAGGAGGAGGGEDAGGGGGGSGGVIYLETLALTPSGLLLATGGGGGQGGTGGGGGLSGEPGDDATTVTAAAGGNMAARGGDGGPGATDTTGNAGSQATAGGGGGGGGTGYILYRGPALGVGTVVDSMPPLLRLAPPT